jgi:WD40 repeat protein
VGKGAMVSQDSEQSNRVRQTPGLKGKYRSGDDLRPGETMTITGGPMCADGLTWWQVTSTKLAGWTAEGDATRYWLVPLRSLIDLANLPQLGEVAAWTWDRDETYDVSFSGDGALLAVGMKRGVSVYDVVAKQEKHFIEVGQRVTRVSLAPNGSRVAGVVDEKSIRVWGLLEYGLQYHLTPDANPIQEVALSPDGQWLAAMAGKTVWVWQMTDGHLADTLSHAGPVSEIAFSPDNQRIASLSFESDAPMPVKVQLWNINDGTLFRRLEFASSARISNLTFAADSQRLRMAVNGLTIETWNIDTGEQETSFAIPSNLSYAYRSINNVFLDDGTVVSVPFFCEEGCAVEAIRWSLDGGVILHTYDKVVSFVERLAAPPNGQAIAVVSDRGLLLYGSGGQLIMTWSMPDYPVYQVQYLGDGQRVALERLKCWNCFLFQSDLWQLPAGVRSSQFMLNYTMHAFSPDVSRVAEMSDCMANEGNWVALLDVRKLAATGNKRQAELWRSEAFPCGGTVVSFSPQANYVAVGSTDHWSSTPKGNGAVRVWRVADGSLVYTLAEHTQGITSIAFSSDSARLASASEDHTIRLWRVSDGQWLTTLSAQTLIPVKVVFSPDGTKVAATLASKMEFNNTEMAPTVYVWRVDDGTLIETLTHNSAVVDLAFSVDGTFLVTATGARLWFWDMANGALLQTRANPSGALTSIAFSPDGKNLYSTSNDAYLRTWGIEP